VSGRNLDFHLGEQLSSQIDGRRTIEKIDEYFLRQIFSKFIFGGNGEYQRVKGSKICFFALSVISAGRRAIRTIQTPYHKIRLFRINCLERVAFRLGQRRPRRRQTIAPQCHEMLDFCAKKEHKPRLRDHSDGREQRGVRTGGAIGRAPSLRDRHGLIVCAFLGVGSSGENQGPKEP
jgi:hypothetical protein